MTELTEREQQMINLYKSGIYQTKITQIMHCKRETLLKALQKANVHILSKSERNRVVQFNPFDQKTDVSDYWLGYFIADGSVATEGNKVFIVSKDLDHLTKWHQYCNNPNKIHISTLSGCGVSGFCNKDVKDYLISIGIPPNKTFTTNLNRSINWSIVRGLFDGDGSIDKTTKTGKTSHIYLITGSKKFRLQLELFFRNEGITYTIQNHTNCWKIVIRKESWVKFGQNMYNNASVFLERKYERYRAILEQSNNDNRMNSGEAQAGNPELSLELNAL